MELPLAYFGNPILRKKGLLIKDINEDILQLVKDMEETMNVFNGIGIAAPQVQRNLALFLINVPLETEDDENIIPGKTRVFINPKILSVSHEEWDRGEGCLSIPKVYGVVSRPLKIKVEALDINGNTFIEEFSDLEARCILHENDHINGVLFIDRVRGKPRQDMELELRKIKKKYETKKR